MPNVVAIIVQNEAGELLVHRRCRTKRVFPGMLGLGAGGKQEPGETLDQAAARELSEETGIVATPEFLFEVHYFTEAVSHCIAVYRVQFDGEIPRQGSEFEELLWYSRDKFLSCCDTPEVCPDTVKFFREAVARGIL